MNIAYLLWGYPHDEAIIWAFQAEGIGVDRIPLAEEYPFGNKVIKELNIADELMTKLTEELREKLSSSELIFSVNFDKGISDFCQQEQIPYCSWVLDLPNMDLYTEDIWNSCNYIGVCDSYLVEKLWKLGLNRVFYLPDAIELGKKLSEEYTEREFVFIAKQPESYLNKAEISLYGKGYLDAFLHGQRVLYGANILENGLINRVYTEVVKNNLIPKGIIPYFHKLFLADYYLAPECTIQQQNIFLQNNANIMTIYSNGGFEMCKSRKEAYLEEEEKRREIYARKEFTLILAPHTLHHGIPRQLFEVIAAGGFPICGFQRDFQYFFEQDKHIAYFTNHDEFNRILIKYGNHPEERRRLQEEAYDLIAKDHTYRNRIQSMLEKWVSF